MLLCCTYMLADLILVENILWLLYCTAYLYLTSALLLVVLLPPASLSFLLQTPFSLLYSLASPFPFVLPPFIIIVFFFLSCSMFFVEMRLRSFIVAHFLFLLFSSTHLSLHLFPLAVAPSLLSPVSFLLPLSFTAFSSLQFHGFLLFLVPLSLLGFPLLQLCGHLVTFYSFSRSLSTFLGARFPFPLHFLSLHPLILPLLFLHLLLLLSSLVSLLLSVLLPFLLSVTRSSLSLARGNMLLVCYILVWFL